MQGGDGKQRLRISNNACKSFSNQRKSRLKLKPAALIRSPSRAFEIVATRPMIVLEMADHGSTAGRRRISRRMALVTRRTWPLIQTLNRSG